MCCSTLIKDNKEKNIERGEECIIKVEDTSEGIIKETSAFHLSKRNKLNSDKNIIVKKKPIKRKHYNKPDANMWKEEKDLAQLLLHKGADPTIISKNGFSPLHLASYKVFRVLSCVN